MYIFTILYFASRFVQTRALNMPCTSDGINPLRLGWYRPFAPQVRLMPLTTLGKPYR